jgi:periplasmic protein TonB
MSMTVDIFENKNKRDAALKTAAYSITLLLLMWFVKIFDGSDLPKPDYGIELNFGTSDIGSGDVQTFNEPNNSPERHESAPPAAKEPNPEPAKAVALPPKVTPEKIKTPPSTDITSKVESPVKVKASENTKPAVQPVKTAPVKPVEPKPEPAKPAPVADAGSLYTKSGSKTGGNGTTGTTSRPGGNNNGDGKPGEIGDKGVPEGKIDAPLYKGRTGSGNPTPASSGSGLQLTGWKWSRTPVVEDDSDETGYIRFEIKVDEEGNLIAVRPVNFTVSQRLVNLYKRAIERVNFVATNSGARPAVSTGTVTIKINPRN